MAAIKGSSSIKTDNLKCGTHSKSEASKFCTTCNQTVCTECISGPHKNHILQSFEKACNEKLDVLTRVQGEIIKSLKHCQNEGAETESLLKSLDSRHGETLKKIDQTEKEIKDMVSKYAQSLRERAETEKKRMKDELTTRKNNIDKTTKELKGKQDTIEKSIKSNDGTAIFQAATDLQEFKKPSIEQCPYEASFIAGGANQKNIAKLFGVIQGEGEGGDDMIRVLQTYTSSMPYIYRLLVQTENSVWVTNFSTKNLKQINIEETKYNLKTIHDISANIFDMAISQNKDIFLSMRDTNEVKMLTKAGKINSLFKVRGLVPRAIHVTKDNRILLGVTEYVETQEELYQVKDDICRKIMVYGMDGKQKQSIGDGDFIFPYRITTNNNKDIIIIDGIKENGGKIVTLSQNGDPKWTYAGNKNMNSDKPLQGFFDRQPFDPRDVVTTAKDNIVIADCLNHAIHILSRKGTLLSCVKISDQKVIFPYSLDIDGKGHLWVGCDASKGKANAQMHILELDE